MLIVYSASFGLLLSMLRSLLPLEHQIVVAVKVAGAVAVAAIVAESHRAD